MYHFVVFLVSIILGTIISIPVGPVAIICARRSLSSGKKWAVFSSLGSVFSDMFYSSVVIFNLGIIISFFEQYKVFIYIFGIIFLFFLGWKSFHTKQVKEIKTYHPLFEPFVIFFINLTNPSIIISFTTLFFTLNIHRYIHTLSDKILFVMGIGLGSLVWCCILSHVVSLLKKKVGNDIILSLYRFSGILILIFALFLSFYAFWEIFLKV